MESVKLAISKQRLRLKAHAEQGNKRKEAAVKRKAIQTQFEKVKKVEKKRKSIEEASVFNDELDFSRRQLIE